MIIDNLNIQNISKKGALLIATPDFEINSAKAIDVDFSGVQLLVYCHLQCNKKIKIQLTKSSAQLLSKAGFASSINEGYLIFN